MKEENRIRKDIGNENKLWWLRSIVFGDSRCVAYVYIDGDLEYDYYDGEYGITPFFVI